MTFSDTRCLHHTLLTCFLSYSCNARRLPISVQSSVSSAICRICLRMSPQALGNTLYALGRLGEYVHIILNKNSNDKNLQTVIDVIAYILYLCDDEINDNNDSIRAAISMANM